MNMWQHDLQAGWGQNTSGFFDKTMLEQLAKSQRYAIPFGYWTLEVFHNDFPLIPEEKVECLSEPHITQSNNELYSLRRETVKIYGRAYWHPVTVTYSVFEDNVGRMLLRDWEELEMVRNATAELTYWLGVDKPDRTWTMKNWFVQGFNIAGDNSLIKGVDLTFLFSEATLTRH